MNELIVADQKIAREIKIKKRRLLKNLKKEYSTLRDKYTQLKRRRSLAYKDFDTKIRPYLAELQRTRLELKKKGENNSFGSASVFNQTSEKEVSTANFRNLYLCVAKLLIHRDKCFDNDIFIQAERAMKERDFETLWISYNQAINLTEALIPERVRTKTRIKRVIKPLMITYLETSISEVNKKIETLNSDNLLKAFKKPETYETYCAAEISKIKQKIEELRSETNVKWRL